MVTAWSEHAARYLLATTLCPRCDADLEGSSVCPSCSADLGGLEGERVWEASRRAGDAVLERQRLIGELSTVSAPIASPITAVPMLPLRRRPLRRASLHRHPSWVLGRMRRSAVQRR